MVLNAGYPNTSGFRKVVKMTVMIRKKEGMSDADFIKHYNGVHAQMAAPVVEKHKAISYTLVSANLHSLNSTIPPSQRPNVALLTLQLIFY